MIDLLFQGIAGLSNVRYISGELDSAVSLRCEIGQLPSNAVVCFLFLFFLSTFHLYLNINLRLLGFIDQKFQQ